MEARVFSEIARKELVLEPGRLYFVDGALSFNPRNPHAEPFQMLIHLVKR
jgi:hypothetical protein